MTQILDMTFQELKDNLIFNQVPVFRAYPIFGWIYRRSVFDFEQMSDLPKDLRPQLAQTYNILALKEIDRVESPDRESVKFLFETDDGYRIESVLLLSEDPEEKDPHRKTVCVSSQAGCPLACNFCATGKMGFQRNLTVPEIVSQILLVDKYAKENYGQIEVTGRALTNIVFMGMGEPMLTYENVMKAIHILNFSGGFHLGMRHYTVSTAGYPNEIRRLAYDNPQLRLAVSLNSANQEKRKTLMPITRKFSITEILNAVKDYQKVSGRRVTFEYVLIKNMNDSEKDVLDLKRSLTGIKYNLNLIIYNPVEELFFERPSDKEIAQFKKYLSKHAIPFVERYSKGREISAGCGQLGMKWKGK